MGVTILHTKLDELMTNHSDLDLHYDVSLFDDYSVFLAVSNSNGCSLFRDTVSWSMIDLSIGNISLSIDLYRDNITQKKLIKFLER